MKTNVQSSGSGFKRKSNYHRKPPKRPKSSDYPWVRIPEGRWAKCTIGILALHKTDIVSAALHRNFREQGLTKEFFYGELIRLLPWFKKHYQITCRYKLSPEIVYNRFHKMVYRYEIEHKIGHPDISKELVTQYSTLKQLVPLVDRFVLAGTPILQEDVLLLVEQADQEKGKLL